MSTDGIIGLVVLWVCTTLLAYVLGEIAGIRRGFRIGTDIDINPLTLEITRINKEQN